MNQVSPILRRTIDGFSHWCPACEAMHGVPNKWKFNGDVRRPTFQPSLRQERARDGKDCHYIVADGKIQFCPDSWHGRSDIVQMPLIPEAFRDGDPTFGIETQD